MLKNHQKFSTLLKKIANLAAFLQNSDIFMQENPTLKKIAAARTVHVSAIIVNFADFRWNNSIFNEEINKITRV